MTNNILQNILHIIIVVELIIGIILWTRWGINNKDKIGYAVAPFLFFINAMLYVLFSISGNISSEFLQDWADIVAIHGVTIMVTGVYAMLYSMNSSFGGGKKNG